MVFFLSGCKGSNTNTRAAAYSRTKKVTKTKTNRKAKVEALMKQCYELAAKGEINKARDIARDLPYRDQFQARENIIKGIHKRARYLAFHGKKNEAKIILITSLKIASSIHCEDTRMRTVLLCIEELASHGFYEEARDISTKTEEYIGIFTGPEPKLAWELKVKASLAVGIARHKAKH